MWAKSFLGKLYFLYGDWYWHTHTHIHHTRRTFAIRSPERRHIKCKVRVFIICIYVDASSDRRPSVWQSVRLHICPHRQSEAQMKPAPNPNTDMCNWMIFPIAGRSQPEHGRSGTQRSTLDFNIAYACVCVRMLWKMWWLRKCIEGTAH